MRIAKSRPVREALAASPDPQVSEKPTNQRSSKAIRTRERLVEAAKEVFEESGFLESVDSIGLFLYPRGLHEEIVSVPLKGLEGDHILHRVRPTGVR